MLTSPTIVDGTSKLSLSPDTLARLNNLELRARLVVEGFITGLHKSPYHGFSVEFAEHRQYMPGDYLRDIDWKVYARTDRHYVKKYEEETNLKAYLLVDCSRSMQYTSRTVTKLAYAQYVAASLAYLMLKQRDAVGLVTFDQTIREYYPPRSVLGYLPILLGALERSKPEKATKLSTVFHDMAGRIKRRGLIIILSDLFDDPKEVLAGLKHFRHRKHEVLIFHILDPMERDFTFRHDAVFQDLETREELNTNAWHIRRAYQLEMAKFLESYKKMCGENKIDYVLLNTAQSLDTALMHFLIKRKHLH